MADLTSTLSGIIEERMPQYFRKAGPTRFPLLEKADKVTQGIKSSAGDVSDIGRLFYVKHGWEMGSAGMLRSTSPYGAGAVDIGSAVRLTDQSNSDGLLAPIPTAAQSPHIGHFTRTLTLHANIGNMGIPVQWMFAQSLDATKVALLVADMKACAEKTVRQDAVSYSSYRATAASGYKVTVLGRIASFAEATAYLQSGSTTTEALTITLDETYGRIENFMEGDEVDIVASSTDTLQDGVATDGTDVVNYADSNVYVQLLVTQVDRINKTITVIGVARPGANSSAESIATYDTTHGWTSASSKPVVAGYWICPRSGSRYIAGTRPWLTNGLEDWMASSGAIMGGATGSEGLDVDRHPMFKSIVKSNLNSRLTPEYMNGYLAFFAQSFPDIKLNAVVTTLGVMLGFHDELRQSAQGQFDVSQAIDVRGGWTFSKWTGPSQSVDFWTSPYCLKNRAYMQQIDAQNLKLYSLPTLGETKAEFAQGIQFLGKLLGYGSIRVPEAASNGTPNLIVGTPWVRFALLCPIMPNGVKIGGITETEFSDLAD